MKTLRLLLAILLFVSTLPFSKAARVGVILTVTAGTPIQLSRKTLFVRRILVQMQAGGTGMGYVMDGVPVLVTPVANTDPTAQLAPATATAPGGSYSDQPSTVNYDIDLNKIWIDGSHTGDKILVSYETVQ